MGPADAIDVINDPIPQIIDVLLADGLNIADCQTFMTQTLMFLTFESMWDTTCEGLTCWRCKP